ncbi:MAG: flagellar M-ring protein FliF [Chloroflexi bacterium]|nr:flagellar M-ring protein FliF [Chloroflexota bacterium]
MFSSLQQQFASYWKRQSLGKQITLVSLILAALILTPVLVNWAGAPSYAIAYTGLSEADASQIVQKLDENSIPYQLKNSGTIAVPNDQVYTVRLLMAREGLPQSSTVGYELFSGTSMLGMTEFSQQVNYQRAIEGELQRTIGSLEAVKAVRVHLVVPEKTLLSSDQALSTASVTIQVNPGYSLDADQVRSITHLVASSVEGLKPENVVVVDTEGNLLADGTGDESQTGPAQKSEQRAAEQAYAAEVQKRVQGILDKILGPNRSVVQATVEMDWTQREITSNTYEPTAVAVRSSQKINESSTEGARRRSAGRAVQPAHAGRHRHNDGGRRLPAHRRDHQLRSQPGAIARDHRAGRGEPHLRLRHGGRGQRPGSNGRDQIGSPGSLRALTWRAATRSSSNPSSSTEPPWKPSAPSWSSSRNNSNTCRSGWGWEPC